MNIIPGGTMSILKKLMIVLCGISIIISPVFCQEDEPQMSLEEALRAMEVVGEWMQIWVIWAYTVPLLEYSDYLYEDELVTGEDCSKLDDAVVNIAEVVQNVLPNVGDAMLQTEGLASIAAIIDWAKYQKQYHLTGDIGYKEKAEQAEAEMEKHNDKIDEYLGSF